MWNNFLITLSIMGKGMVGIFTVIIIISLVVALMGRLGAGKKKMRIRLKNSIVFQPAK